LCPLTRTSVVKASLDKCCINDVLKRILQETVVKARNFTYIAALFMNYLVINRLANNLPFPPINQTFCYQVFCQLTQQGKNAPDWVKQSYAVFAPFIPQHIKDNYHIHTALISVYAKYYSTNAVNHLVKNFEKKSLDYFFCRFSDEHDDWFLANVQVKTRKKLAVYSYGKAAHIEVRWPAGLESIIRQSTIDGYAESVDLGPVPVDETTLSANAHAYLPWFYEVLKRIEKKVCIKEPKPQNYASRSYVSRELKQVRGLH
jgi:hypothetical protein